MPGVPFAPLLAEAPEVADAAALARVRRALITRRLPYFAAGWIGIGVILRAGLVAHGRLSLPLAVGSILLQAAVLGTAIVWCRRAPEAPRVPAVAFGTCAVLVLLLTAFFVLLHGSIEGFVFGLVMICLGSSLAFAWGWRPALALLALAGGVGGAAIAWAPSLHHFSDSTEILLEALIGGAIALTVAETSARSVARTFREAEALRASGRRLAAALAAYRDLAENAPDLIYTHDLDGRITYVNEAFARFAGEPASLLVGRDGGTLVPRDANPDPAALRARLAAGESVPPQLFWVKTPAGRRWLECATSPIRDADGTIVGARGIVRDVTERQAAEEALRTSLEDLRRSEERLRRLARRQASIREEERKRLGFDLHDDVCQELIGIGILVESVRRKVDAEAPGLGPELARIATYVGEVGEHLRQLARDLRPMQLRELGLQESLQALAEAITAAGSPPTSARFSTPIPRLEEEVEIGVYRIAQEALTNAVRHAGASAIRVTLAVEDGRLELEVADDGRGFAPEARRGSDALGLVGMEERALALGGRLAITAAPGEGTTVRLVCPVAPRAMSAA